MASAPITALNASDQTATRTCAWSPCGRQFKALRKWAKFCCGTCRKADFDERLRQQHVRDYMREIGRKGAAVTNAKRKKAA